MPPKPKYSSAEQKKTADALRKAFEAGRIGPRVESLIDSVTGPGWKERRAYQRVSFGEAMVLLRRFADEFGHTAVPVQYRTADGVALGSWVLNVRTGRSRTGLRRLLPEQEAALEELPGWSWNRRADRVEQSPSTPV